MSRFTEAQATVARAVRAIALNDRMRDTLVVLAAHTTLAQDHELTRAEMEVLAVLWRRRGDELKEAAALLTEAAGLAETLTAVGGRTRDEVLAEAVAFNVAAGLVLGSRR